MAAAHEATRLATTNLLAAGFPRTPAARRRRRRSTVKSTPRARSGATGTSSRITCPRSHSPCRAGQGTVSSPVPAAFALCGFHRIRCRAQPSVRLKARHRQPARLRRHQARGQLNKNGIAIGGGIVVLPEMRGDSNGHVTRYAEARMSRSAGAAVGFGGQRLQGPTPSAVGRLSVSSPTRGPPHGVQAESMHRHAQPAPHAVAAAVSAVLPPLRVQCRLRPVGELELVEDARHVVLHRLQ